MTQYVDNFKNNAAYICEQTVEIGKGIGQRIITLDRSNQQFVETPESHPEAQLKGRDRMITYELARVVVGTLLIAFFTYQCIAHPGGLNYFLAGTAGFFTLVALKEVAIQNIARQKEKKKFGIEEENEDTKFPLHEMVDEVTKGIKDDVHRSLNKLGIKCNNSNVTENVD